MGHPIVASYLRCPVGLGCKALIFFHVQYVAGFKYSVIIVTVIMCQ
jgi:hypothetical protein